MMSASMANETRYQINEEQLQYYMLVFCIRVLYNVHWKCNVHQNQRVTLLINTI